MRKKRALKIISLSLLFIVVFILSALICVKITGSLPEKLLKVKWDESVGTVYNNLNYENEENHQYDLYVPVSINKDEAQYLILYIHGGSFNSGAKEDGASWCKYYASKGYITASLDYTLQKKGAKADLYTLNEQIKNCVTAINNKCNELGYTMGGMATCGVSAGGTLAMNYAYKCAKTSAIPVKFVFQLAGPSDFEPTDWSLLKRVNKIETDNEFLYWMTGKQFTDEMIASKEYTQYVNEISPARLVNQYSVPSLIGYGLKDHAVPSSSRTLLVNALENCGATYKYFEFPNSNHGMYADLDILQNFLDESVAFCKLYFN